MQNSTIHIILGMLWIGPNKDGCCFIWDFEAPTRFLAYFLTISWPPHFTCSLSTSVIWFSKHRTYVTHITEALSGVKRTLCLAAKIPHLTIVSTKKRNYEIIWAQYLLEGETRSMIYFYAEIQHTECPSVFIKLLSLSPLSSYSVAQTSLLGPPAFFQSLDVSSRGAQHQRQNAEEASP